MFIFFIQNYSLVMISFGVSLIVEYMHTLLCCVDNLFAVIGVVGTFPLINDYTKLLQSGKLFGLSVLIFFILNIMLVSAISWCFDWISMPSLYDSLSILYGGDKGRTGQALFKVHNLYEDVTAYWNFGQTYLFPTNWFLDEAMIINYIFYVPELVFLFCLFSVFFHGLFATTVRDVELDEYPILVNYYILIMSGVFFSVAVLFYEMNFFFLEYFCLTEDAELSSLSGYGHVWNQQFQTFKEHAFLNLDTERPDELSQRLMVLQKLHLQPFVLINFFIKYTGVLCLMQSICNPIIIYIKICFALLASFILLIIGCSAFFNNHRLNNYEFAFIFSLVIYTSWVLLATVSWLILYLTLELQALCLLILIAWDKNSILALNTSLKYGVVNIVASALFLFGIIHLILLQGDHIISYTLITLNFHLKRSNVDTLVDFLFNTDFWPGVAISPSISSLSVQTSNASAYFNSRQIKYLIDQQQNDFALIPDYIAFANYLNIRLQDLYSGAILNFNQYLFHNSTSFHLGITQYREVIETWLPKFHYHPSYSPFMCFVSERFIDRGLSGINYSEDQWGTFFQLSQYRKIMFLTCAPYSQIYTVTLSFILTGLLIKLGAAPVAFWVAEVYAGMSVPVLMLFSTLPKLTYIFILFNSILAQFYNLSVYSVTYATEVLPVIQTLFLLLALVSAVTGALGLLKEHSNIAKFLAWSSIINLGFLFLICSFSLIAPSVYPIGEFGRVNKENFLGQSLQNGLTLSLLFFIFYFIQIIFVLGVLNFYFFTYYQRSILYFSDLLVFGRHSTSKPLLVVLSLSFLSLFGLPPLAGFWGKFFVFLKLIQSYDMTLMSISFMLLILVINIIGGFGYIKIVYMLIAEQRKESNLLFLTEVRWNQVIFIGYLVFFILWQFFSFSCFQLCFNFLTFFDFCLLGDVVSLLS